MERPCEWLEDKGMCSCEYDRTRPRGIIDFIRSNSQPTSPVTEDEFDRFINEVMRLNLPRQEYPRTATEAFLTDISYERSPNPVLERIQASANS